MRILFLGDVVGVSGCSKLISNLSNEIRLNEIDFVIVNGENAAQQGVGLTKDICQDFFNCGVNVITTGNHVWDQKDIMNFIDKDHRLLRPKNLFEPAPGKGFKIYTTQKDIKDKVQRNLANNFEVQLGVRSTYKINWGSTYVQVELGEATWNPSTKEEDAYWVNVSSPVLFGIEGSSELFKYVATEGPKSLAGLSMALWEAENDNTYSLWLESNILGNFIDEAELVNVVVICGLIADREDEDLAQRFGGSVVNPDANTD